MQLDPSAGTLTARELAASITALVPELPMVAAAARVGDHRVDPREAHLVARAAAVRRDELAAGRAAARHALARLGVDAVAIDAGPDRAPCWPHGVVGSISHAAGWAAAAVAASADVLALGIDIEAAAPLSARVSTLVVSDRDRIDVPAHQRELASVVAFSAKEAVYKALWPQWRRALEFHDVALTLRSRGDFTADTGAPPGVVTGRWTLIESLGLVTSIVALARPGSRESKQTVAPC